MFSITLEWR